MIFFRKRLKVSEYDIHGNNYQYAFCKHNRLKIISLGKDDIIYDTRLDKICVKDWYDPS